MNEPYLSTYTSTSSTPISDIEIIGVGHIEQIWDFYFCTVWEKGIKGEKGGERRREGIFREFPYFHVLPHFPTNACFLQQIFKIKN